MKKLFLATLFLFASLPCLAQTDNTFYAKQFPGLDLGAKVTAAQLACIPSVPCIIIIDPSMANIGTGLLPVKCALCTWIDYRAGFSVDGTGCDGSTSGSLFQQGAVSGSECWGANQVAGNPSIVHYPTADPSEGQALFAHAATGGVVQLFWATPAGGAAPLISRLTGCDTMTASSLSTTSCAVSGLAGGETIVINMIYSVGVTLSSVIDSAGGTPILIQNVSPANPGGVYAFAQYYVKNAASGSHTITINFSAASTYLGLYVDALSHTSTTAPLDASSFVSSGVANLNTVMVGANLTTNHPSDFIYVFGNDGNPAATLTAGTVPSTFTLWPTSSYPNSAREGAVLTAPGSTYATLGRPAVSAFWYVATLAFTQ